MDLDKFSKISESLRQYRRAELRDFEAEIGEKPVDQLYVDALPGGAVLQAVLSSNTTFLLGRKGTGKSTVFAKAQSTLRERKDVISIYIDVKSLYDVLEAANIPDEELEGIGVSNVAYRSHMLRKIMLGKVIAELLKEVSESCDKLNFLERWRGVKKQYDELKSSLNEIGVRVKNSKLEKHEIPVLQKITNQLRIKQQQESSTTASADGKMGTKLNLDKMELSAEASGSLSDFDKTLDDSDIYNEYSDVVLKSFPFGEILDEIQILISEAGLVRLVAFFDDFSELALVDQRLFVDVVLSPLNNSSNETVKLKVAGYPGRVYYGKIDPGKADTIGLDFSDLYEASEVQEMERSASDYAFRLLTTRFSAFGEILENYFDVTSTTSIEDHMNMMFKASFNVPRIMGHILHICYLDKVSKGQKITIASIRLASRKYYENTISKYFDRLNRYALEPFENKLDRHNQQQLLNCIIEEARSVRKRIVDREVGGKYFEALGGNPQTSHFIVSPDLEEIFSSLESNFFLSRYKATRDKAGNDVIVYALFLGLCESERMNWGYPEGREFRNYFVQRCFEYTRAIHQYLSQNQTIKCGQCGFCHPMEKRESIELFKWRCPECMEGTCSIVNLSDDFKEEVEKLNKEIMLDPVELDIVTTLNEEQRRMRAGEISALIDTTHQMVGKRTSKLQEMGLIDKERDAEDGKMRSELTDRCEKTYFE
ncbi:MAG: winged helix DNA-binding protein [Pseudomonadales bacterium]|nr:winged helix DNA-binding protein [Pseudomonadales bacterium]